MQHHTLFAVRCRAVIAHEGKLLVVKHRPEADYYALPGGHLEIGEDVESCLAREIVEELGVMPRVGKLLYVRTFTDRNERDSLEFFFEVVNGADYVTLADASARSHAFELAEVRWISAADEANLLPREFMNDFKNGTYLQNAPKYTRS